VVLLAVRVLNEPQPQQLADFIQGRQAHIALALDEPAQLRSVDAGFLADSVPRHRAALDDAA
jgi:hypothetical protein